MERETERAGGLAAGSGPAGARSAKPGHDPMMSLPPGACPGGETAMRPSGPGGAEATGGDNAIMPSPRLLLGSMVCNAAVGHRLAAKVERKGGWTA